MTSSSNIVLKFHHDNEIRRRTFPVNVDWADISDYVKVSYGLQDPWITFEDEEHELCRITCQAEFKEATTQAGRTSLSLTVKESCKPKEVSQDKPRNAELVLEEKREHVTAVRDSESQNEEKRQPICQPCDEAENKKAEKKEEISKVDAAEEPNGEQKSQGEGPELKREGKTEQVLKSKEDSDEEEEEDSDEEEEEENEVGESDRLALLVEQKMKLLRVLQDKHDDLLKTPTTLISNALIFFPRLLKDISCPTQLSDCGPDSRASIDMLLNQAQVLQTEWKKRQQSTAIWEGYKPQYIKFRLEILELFNQERLRICKKGPQSKVLRKVDNSWHPHHQRTVKSCIPLSECSYYVSFENEPNPSNGIYGNFVLNQSWAWSPILKSGVDKTIECLKMLNV